MSTLKKRDALAASLATGASANESCTVAQHPETIYPNAARIATNWHRVNAFIKRREKWLEKEFHKRRLYFSGLEKEDFMSIATITAYEVLIIREEPEQYFKMALHEKVNIDYKANEKLVDNNEYFDRIMHQSGANEHEEQESYQEMLEVLSGLMPALEQAIPKKKREILHKLENLRKSSIEVCGPANLSDRRIRQIRDEAIKIMQDELERWWLHFTLEAPFLPFFEDENEHLLNQFSEIAWLCQRNKRKQFVRKHAPRKSKRPKVNV
ncbi:hypothetical protein Selin_1415 [Desulfurispirillum indicum S5]|uniref:Uncharacterized protein n=1 Tax=Desulfurispirillum indicum (strain ATCC BAA-1389 / DSM 22839 / S5) TaxID=653733 RepID=E6W6B4_DESIS|nr:hypothetical protein [Desulfurispirillum indicum]ADU66150.1 hypothetical protein Selin_1415 [Desulfurispirillum indicum S5]